MNKSDVIKCLWLRQTFSYHQRPSGYDTLCDYLENTPHFHTRSVERGGKHLLPEMFLSRWMKRFKTNATYDKFSLDAEIRAYISSLFFKPDLIHLLYLEFQYSLWARKRVARNIKRVATAHEPETWWKLFYKKSFLVKELDALIVMSSKMKHFFEQMIPGKVHLIKHGVDISCFRPSTDIDRIREKREPRFVFAGITYRDFFVLEKVIADVLNKNSDIQFDLVIPNMHHLMPYIYRIARHSQVHFYKGLSPENLRDLYCSADALILPLEDAGANNTLVEAISCGVPVISTNVGGVTDHTAPEFSELFEIGDWEGMSEAVLRCSKNRKDFLKKRILAREYAEKYLSWEKTAEETAAVYMQVLKGVHAAGN